MEKIRIRYNLYKHPGYATLLTYSLFYAFSLQCKAQPGEPLRLATGGSDAHVVIWNVKEGDEGKVHNPLLFSR
jgi:hypothetical protein